MRPDDIAPQTVPPTGRFTRRRVLVAFGLGATGAILAACAPAPTTSPTTAPAASTPATASTPAATTAPAPTTAAAAATPAATATTPAAAPTSAAAATAVPTSAAQTTPASAVSPAASPAASTSASGGTKLVPFYTTENDPVTLDFYNKTITAFKQSNPGTDVKVTVYQDENQLQYLTTGFQTGTDLGIFASPSAQVPAWAQAGFLLPLDSLIQSIGPDDFLEGTRIVVNGHDYAMPFQSNASALWCRTDLFQKEGLKLPTTYDEFLAAAKALNKGGISGIATGVGTVPQLTLQYFTPYIYQSGWDYFDKDGNLTFDKPAVLDAVKRFADILRNAPKSFANVTYPDIINAYVAGKAAMGTFPGRLGVNTDSKAPKIAEATTVIPIPAGPFMTGKLFYGGIQHYVSYAKTKNPDETQAFLKFLTTGDRELEFSMTVPGHLLPPLKSVRAQVPNYKSDFMTRHGDWVTKQLDMVPGASDPSLSMGTVNNQQWKKISNVVPWGSQIWNGTPVDGTMFQQILLNNVAPEKAWTDAAAKMKQIADAWKQQNPNWKPSPT